MTNSTERVKSLDKRRITEGWVRLRDWLKPAAAKKLDRMCSAQGKRRADVIADLVNAAPEP